MPRIRVWFDKETMERDPGNNDPLDFCQKCWGRAVAKYQDNPLAEICEDDHPPYNDTNYCCENCGKRLTEKDD